ncbi:methyltransferase [Bacillus sp. DJP31]|uniref:methyltransferase n=1 Tax=Bacillus sp. DJP31 TaxID=3409789 RepID=UPI003BB56FE4
MKEKEYDDLLSISTGGNPKESSNSLHYHRYEPTPYRALEDLFSNYQLKSSDQIVDFGCGKGRLNFFVNDRFNCSVVGVEMNETLTKEATENRRSYVKKHPKGKKKIHFQCCLAEEYEIDPLDNVFYFFNPFTIQIFRKIINNILLSVEQSEREIELVLYYPSEDYIYFLENHTSFQLNSEIMLAESYKKDPFERFLIYRLVGL